MFLNVQPPTQKKETTVTTESPKITQPPGGTIFHQDWMMDAASRGRWEQAEIVENGKTVARLPYVVIKKFGTRTIGKPYYSRVLGPTIQLPGGKANRHLEHTTNLITELYRKLPSHDRFHQSIGPENDYTAGFVLSGFNVGAGYTFRISPDVTPNQVMSSMKGASRRNIVTTFDRLTVHEHVDLDIFTSLARQTKRGSSNSCYRFDELQSIFTAAEQRGQAVILTAQDESGRNMGTTILLYDAEVAYFWLTARNLVPGNRAYSRLLWEAYMWSHRHGLIFDLDGYPSLSGARFLANFGGVPAVRNTVERTNLVVDTLRVANDLANAVLIGKGLCRPSEKIGPRGWSRSSI